MEQTLSKQGYFGNPAMKFRRLSNQAAGAGRDGKENSGKKCLDNGNFMQFPIPSSVSRWVYVCLMDFKAFFDMHVFPKKMGLLEWRLREFASFLHVFACL